MKIGIEQQKYVKDISKNYKDTFEEYNEDVDALVKESIRVLATAKKKQAEAKRIVSEVEAKKNNLATDLINKEKDIQALSLNKKKRQEEYIAEERQKFIEKADVHSKAEIDDLSNQIKACMEQSRTAQSSIRLEDLTAKYQLSNDKDVDRSNALDAVIKDLGHTYGLFPSKEKFTPEFSNLYKKVRDSYASQQDILQAGVTKKQKQDILQDYADNYKVNPYKILRIPYAIFFLPLFVVRKFLQPNVRDTRGAIQGIIYSFTAGDVMSKVLCGGSLLVWLVYMIFILCKRPLLIAALVIGTLTTAVYMFAKKQSEPYIEMLIRSSLYYSGFSNDSQAKAQSELDAETAKLRQRYSKKADILKSKLEMFNEENDNARKKAAQHFVAGNISMADIEKDYQNKLASENAERDRIKKNLEAMEKKLSDAKTNLNESINLFQNAKEQVTAMFGTGMKRDVTNGFNNPDIGVTESRNFVYHFAYLNVYSMINGFYVSNPFGFAIDSVNISNIEGPKKDFNDIPLHTIPVCMKKVDIIDVCKNSGIDIEIANILINIIKNAGEEIVDGIRKINPKLDLGDYYTDANLDKFDTMNIYKVEVASHDNKCALILYDGDKDQNYVKTISRFIYERLFKCTYLATNPSSARHHFIVEDRTYFDDGNILLLTRRAGAASEGKDAAIKKMEADGIYDIVDKNGYESLLKTIREKRMVEFREACADISGRLDAPVDTNVEYILTAKAKGSTPQMMDYLYLWLKPRDIWNQNLKTILQSTGGSKVEGAESSTNNIYGVVPFIFLDMALLREEKPKEDELRAMKEIVNCISVNNFFYVSSGANSLCKKDIRKTVIEGIDKAIEKAHNH